MLSAPLRLCDSFSVWWSDVVVPGWGLHLGTGMCDDIPDRCGHIFGIANIRGLPRRTVYHWASATMVMFMFMFRSVMVYLYSP